MTGLFFCLASAEGAGLLFLPCCNTAQYNRLQRLLSCPCSYTSHPQNSAQGFAVAFLAICFVLPPLCGGCICLYCTTCATLERITAPGRPPAHTRYHRHTRTLHSSAQPPYYNKAYKGAAVCPCYGSTPDGAADCRPCQPGGAFSHCVRIAGKCCALRTC